MKHREHSSTPETTKTVIFEALDGKNHLNLSKLDSREETKKLGKEIDAALTAFYASPEAEKSTANCNKMVHQFGLDLAGKDKDDSSFFARHPLAIYEDVRSEGGLEGKFSRYDHHSVGLLYLPLDEKRKIFIALDLTYDTIGGGPTRTLVFVGQSEAEVMSAIKNHYGGDWEKAYRLRPGDKNYKFLE